MIRLEDGTVLFGPMGKRPADHDPVVCVSVDGQSYWVKHSRVSPTADQSARIRYWARRMARHGNDTSVAILHDQYEAGLRRTRRLLAD